jgi:hypothetical protein
VGEGEVLERRIPGPGGEMPVEDNKGDQTEQAPDVLLRDPAMMGRLAPRVVSKKVAVVFFHVGVTVISRRCHKVDVTFQVVVRGVSPVGIEGFHQEGTEFQVKRVLPGLQELVIMDASFAPVLRLVVKNIALFVERTIGRAPQDAVRMGIPRGNKIGHVTIVPPESDGVVIPVHRHSQGVTDKKPVESSPAT